jgi:hypothetical protein
VEVIVTTSSERAATTPEQALSVILADARAHEMTVRSTALDDWVWLVMGDGFVFVPHGLTTLAFAVRGIHLKPFNLGFADPVAVFTSLVEETAGAEPGKPCTYRQEPHSPHVCAHLMAPLTAG